MFQEPVQYCFKRAQDPRKPSQSEGDQHNLTHLPYRSWCTHCVRGRGGGASSGLLVSAHLSRRLLLHGRMHGSGSAVMQYISRTAC